MNSADDLPWIKGSVRRISVPTDSSCPLEYQCLLSADHGGRCVTFSSIEMWLLKQENVYASQEGPK